MLENVKAVIFDLDGTLVDSMWVWTSVDHDYIEKYNLTVPENFYAVMEGMSFTETAQHFLDTFPEIKLSLEDLKSEWIAMAEEKYCHEVPLKKGVREFLAELNNRGIRTGMATSNSRVLAEGLSLIHIYLWTRHIIRSWKKRCFFTCQSQTLFIGIL